MKLSALLAELNHAMEAYGDIEVQVQSCPDSPSEMIMNDTVFFVVPEPYRDKGLEEMVVNIRTWPY